MNNFKFINGKDVDVTEKWESLGFLEGCENKILVANAFEKTVNLLLTRPGFNSIETMAFPVIRRIFDKSRIEPNSNELSRLVLQILQEFKTAYDSFDPNSIISYSSFDLEAEFTAMFCDKYKENNPSIMGDTPIINGLN